MHVKEQLGMASAFRHVIENTVIRDCHQAPLCLYVYKLHVWILAQSLYKKLEAANATQMCNFHERCLAYKLSYHNEWDRSYTMQ